MGAGCGGYGLDCADIYCWGHWRSISDGGPGYGAYRSFLVEVVDAEVGVERSFM